MVKQAIYHATTASIWKKIRDNGFKIPENDWARFYVGNIKKKRGAWDMGCMVSWMILDWQRHLSQRPLI
ncbi:hypothetical protein [Lentilactobacillus kisonensis]|uniref:hypothetical protein n=1 Tax=Lentilactobacillus kisonensis TaxID=481722 RepID=UPI0006D0153E|nr:hypothetical protein [Lentilactobacillus kisonensis]